MKKLTRRGTVLGCTLILLLTILIMATFLSRLSQIEKDRHQAIDYLSRMSDLDYRLKQGVLEAHSFMQKNYDSLVVVTNGTEQICSQFERMDNLSLFSNSRDLSEDIRRYCQLAQARLQVIEKFKSKNSLLQNSIHFFPTLVSNFEFSDNRLAAQHFYTDVLNFCLQPSKNLASQLDTDLKKLRRIRTRNQRDASAFLILEQHANVVITSAVEREVLEKTINSSESRAAINKLTAHYLAATDRIESQSNYWKAFAIFLTSTLLVTLLYLLYRLQLTAESLRDLNQNLENKVVIRTSELANALSDLEIQQQYLSHATKMSALGEMAGGIAHEINTPLAAISLKAESIIMLEEITPQTAKGLEEIILVVQRLSKIVTGLRRFSRDSHHEEMSQMSVAKIVDDTLDLCRQKFVNHGIELRLNIDPVVTLRCLPEQISQVFLNLLNNSFDAIQKNPEKWVAIEALISTDGILIRFSDSGTGIPLAVREKMMQPFFTTKEVGSGTGIGLSISSGIVQKHGGALNYLESCGNTTFELCFQESQVRSAA